MKQRKFSAEEKASIVLEVLRGDRTISEVCREHGVAQSLFYKWRDKFMSGAISSLSGHGKGVKTGENGEVRQLKQIIGELTIENQILKKTQDLMGSRSK
jgi:transposase